MHALRMCLGGYFSQVQAVLGDKRGAGPDFLQQSLNPAGLKNLKAHDKKTLLIAPSIPPNSHA